MQLGDFVSTYGPLSQDISEQTGLHPSVVLGVIGNETGYGEHVVGSNIFGISPVTSTGQQYVAGYPDVQTASKRFIDLINSKYHGATLDPDPDKQIAGLVKLGYNRVNPNYASSVSQIASRSRSLLGDQSQSQSSSGPDYNSGNVPPPQARTQTASNAPDYNTPSTSTTTAAPPSSGNNSLADDLTKRFQTHNQSTTSSPPQAGGDNDLAKDLKTKFGIKDAPATTPPPGNTGTTTPPPPQGDQRPWYQRLLNPDPKLADAMTPQGDQQPDVQSATTPSSTPFSLQKVEEALTPSGNLVHSESNTPFMSAISPVATNKLTGKPQFTLPDIVRSPLLGAVKLMRGEGSEGSGWRTIADPDVQNLLLMAAGGKSVAEGGPAAADTNALLQQRVAQVAQEAKLPPPPQTVPTLSTLTDAIRRADTQPSRSAAAEAPGASTAAPEAKPAAAEGPQPQAAGAQATPPGQTSQAQTAKQAQADRITNLEKQSATKAPERANAQGKDTAKYVEDVEPLHASIDPQAKVKVGDQEVRLADAHQALMNTDGEYEAFVKGKQQENNDIMSGKIRDMAGDANAIQKAEDAREALGDTMRDAALKNAKPVDAQPLVDHIDDVLRRGGNKDPAVTGVLNDIKSRLYEGNAPMVSGKAGKLESDPNVLYSLRQAISKQLSTKGMAANPQMGLARAEVTDFMGRLDSQIEKGAPGYKAYMDAYADASKGIDQMRALQNYTSGSKSVFNNRTGTLELNRVQGAIDGLIKDMKAKGVNPAKHVTDDQMQTLFSVRDQLARDNALNEASATRGSPTAKLFTNAARVSQPVPVRGAIRAGAGEVSNALLHLGLLKTTAGVGNALVIGTKAVKGMRAASQLKRALREQAALDAQKAALKQQLMSAHPEYGL